MAEDLTDYYREMIKVRYGAFSTLERQIIRWPQVGRFDVLIGINLYGRGRSSEVSGSHP